MINYACRHFQAAKPCLFNKMDGSECPSCQHVSEYRERILFIKLDAIGDVLRSASLLPAIAQQHIAPFIVWLTREEAADLVRMIRHVDEVITLSEEGLARIAAGAWDRVYSLSNDLTSASLATLAAGGGAPVGFYMQSGVIHPSNSAATNWLQMATFDRLKRTNRQSYQKLMLDIIGRPNDPVPPPALEVDHSLQQAAAARLAELFGGRPRSRIAVNIGAGGRWPKKMLNAEQIHRYARQLQQRADVDIVLVGGAAETEKAVAIAALCTGDARVRAALTGHSLPEFVALLTQVDALLCGDTLALHIAAALGLPTVAVFGPTSSAEIFDFDGLITKVWTDELDCLVCYGDCQKQKNCMSLLKITALVDRTIEQLKRAQQARASTRPGSPGAPH